jgi:hypothetical protein
LRRAQTIPTPPPSPNSNYARSLQPMGGRFPLGLLDFQRVPTRHFRALSPQAVQRPGHPCWRGRLRGSGSGRALLLGGTLALFFGVDRLPERAHHRQGEGELGRPLVPSRKRRAVPRRRPVVVGAASLRQQGPALQPLIVTPRRCSVAPSVFSPSSSCAAEPCSWCTITLLRASPATASGTRTDRPQTASLAPSGTKFSTGRGALAGWQSTGSLDTRGYLDSACVNNCALPPPKKWQSTLAACSFFC